MGKLKDLAIEFANRSKGPQCSVSRLLGGMTAQDRLELEAELVGTVPASALSEAINKLYGVVIKAHIIGRHRRGDCKCPS
jgi:hypothetical protein